VAAGWLVLQRLGHADRRWARGLCYQQHLGAGPQDTCQGCLLPKTWPSLIPFVSVLD
jgi:hypothetical protein